MGAPRSSTPRGPSKAPLRPLGLPRPAQVRTDDHGLPVEVTRTTRRGGGVSLHVEEVEEVWHIAEEWWREAPIGRTYYRVIVDGGRPLTLFHDTQTSGGDGWYEQRY
jgi:hypothetical protein